MVRKVALVSGGARRVGAAIVRSFAERGYDVVLHHGNSPEAAAVLGVALEREFGVPLLGQVPIEMAVREGGDNGRPITLAAPESASNACRGRFGLQLWSARCINRRRSQRPCAAVEAAAE